MFKYLQNVDLSSYGMYLNKASIKMESSITTIELEFNLPSASLDIDSSAKDLDRFFLDLQLLNTLHGSTSTTVQKHYEELLMLLALSKPNKLEDK